MYSLGVILYRMVVGKFPYKPGQWGNAIQVRGKRVPSFHIKAEVMSFPATVCVYSSSDLHHFLVLPLSNNLGCWH